MFILFQIANQHRHENTTPSNRNARRCRHDGRVTGRDRIHTESGLYRDVLKEPLGDLGKWARAKRPARLPTWLSPHEMQRLLDSPVLRRYASSSTAPSRHPLPPQPHGRHHAILAAVTIRHRLILMAQRRTHGLLATEPAHELAFAMS